MRIFVGIRSISVFFMAAVLIAGVSAQNNIAPKLEEIQPLQPGDMVPAFTVFRQDGTARVFDPLKVEQTTLIVFYRGGWCGACNQQLRALSTVMGDINEMDVDVMFINGDRPEILYSSLKPETKTAIKGLDYMLLSDSDLIAAQAFGVAYVLDDEILKRYRSREEWDLYMSSIDKHDALPLPSIFIINTNGEIAFEYYNMDPTIRIPPEDLKAELEKLLASKPH
jgi:peroxiredoxin